MLSPVLSSFFVGFLPYGYLVWASVHPTRGSWGDLTTVAGTSCVVMPALLPWPHTTHSPGFLKHLLRSEYGTFQLSPMKATSLMSDRLRLCVAGCAVLYGCALRVKGSPCSTGAWGWRNRYAHHVYESLPFAPASAAVLALGLADAVCDTTTVCSRSDVGRAPSRSRRTSPPKTPAGGPLPAHSFASGTRIVVISWALYVAVPALPVRGTPSVVTSPCRPARSYVVVFHYLANLPTGGAMAEGVLARFWMQPDGAMFVVFGMGVAAIPRLLTKAASLRDGAGVVVRAVTVFVCLALPLVAVTTHLDTMDRSGSGGELMGRYMAPNVAGYVCDYAEPQLETCAAGWCSLGRFGEAVLQSVPPNSLLLSQTDLNWNTVRYLQVCGRLGSRFPCVAATASPLLPSGRTAGM